MLSSSLLVLLWLLIFGPGGEQYNTFIHTDLDTLCSTHVHYMHVHAFTHACLHHTFSHTLLPPLPPHTASVGLTCYINATSTIDCDSISLHLADYYTPACLLFIWKENLTAVRL